VTSASLLLARLHLFGHRPPSVRLAVDDAHLILSERMAVLASPQPERYKAASLVLRQMWAGMMS